MALFRFFVYSNFFIAACAILMVNQTYQLLLHSSPDFYLLAFVLFSTICSYSFHWYLSSEKVVIATPRTSWQQQYKNIHLALFLIGLAGAAVFFLYLADDWIWLVLAAVITFLYSAPKIPHKHFRALRKVAIGKTIFLSLVWTYVTTILPLLISDREWRADFYLFIASRFFLVYAICILFDYRDREDDKSRGIRSLITWLNDKGIRNLFVLSLCVFAAATICLVFFQYPAWVIALLLIPGIITAALYKQALKNFSDLLYYFVLDGMMALSALLTLLTGI